jgi:ABC-2 type transport system permease protein
MSQLAGTGVFVRLFVRRDRLMLFWWIAGNVLLYWSQAVSVDSLYSTQAEFDAAAASMEKNAAFIAMAGPARALNTTGGQVAWQATAFGAIVAGLMSMFIIGRHTRAEEESGRDELIRSAVVGRYAPMTAALIVAGAANVLLGALVTGSLLSYGLEAAGSVAIGVGLTLAGLVFATVALLAAQLTEGTRAMYGITGAVIGVAYALRAVGDIGSGALSMVSPIGWYQALRPYAGEVWWPLLLSAAGAVVSTAVAYAVFDRRDIGAGVWASRPGPDRAHASLHGHLGLAFRLQRGSLIGWTVAMLLGGLGYGSIGDDVGALIGDSELSKDVFTQGGGSLVDSFYATSALMLALIAGGFTVSSALRARGEEEAGRAEPLLATSLPRARWAMEHAAVTLVGTLAVLAAGGLGMGVGYALVADDSAAVGRYAGATLAYAAPVLVVAALGWLAFGLSTRLGSLAWLGLGFCVVVMFFGELLRFPDWLRDISPFSHLALVPAQDFEPAPFLTTLAVAVVLGALGLVALRRRDLH